MVVDDFLANAEDLRQAALRLTYPQVQGNFPGRNSVERINIGGLDEQVSHLLNEPLEAMEPPGSHAKSRLTLAGDKGRGKVHIDLSHWSGILYLSRPEDCRGGTDFFRHRRTGTDRAPTTQEELTALGYASAEDMHRDIIAKDGNDEFKWELLTRVPMRFNRLLLLRPVLCTRRAGFRRSAENGRLVYLMFFKAASRAGPHG